MSLRFLRRCVTALSMAAGLLAAGSSQAQAQAGSISGRVTDAGTGAPVSAAQVQVAGLTLGTVSGDDGTYRISNVPVGSHVVIARRIGYSEQRSSMIVVTAGSTATANLSLRPSESLLTTVAVTGTRNQPEKLLDSPNQISVVSSERIAERPALTATDHLQSTAGVDVSRGGLVQANIVTRGFNNAFSGAVLMLQDYRFAGVPSLRVNVPFLFTGTNEDIDRMEVLLGPASALYGPNSANGVLHIITKSPFTSQGTTFSLDGGERSVMRFGARHARNLTEKAAIKLSGEFMRGRDWEYRDPAEPAVFPAAAPEGRRGLVNERDFDIERATGEARLDIRPRDDMELITTYGYTKVGSGIELTGANGSAQIKNWTYQNIQQRFRWGRLFAQAFVNSSNAGNDDASSTSGTYLLRSGQPIVDKSSVAVAQVQHGLDLFDGRQRLIYGADYIATNPETGGTINGRNEARDNVREWGGYLQSTTQLTDKFDFVGAVRFDQNNVIDGSFFSPRIAALFKPTNTQTIRATYNRAFQTPANFTFFLDLVQSRASGLNPYDVFAQGNPPKQGFQFNRSCAGGGFGDVCMRSPFTGGAFQGVNANQAFRGLWTGAGTQLQGQLQQIITGVLMAGGQSAAAASGAAQALAPLMRAAAANNTATAAQLPALVTIGSTVLSSPTQLADIAPLRASFNNTYEVGYKAFLGGKLNLDMSLWTQQRGDVGLSAAQATPVVITAPQAMQAYLGQLWAPILAGLPEAARNAIVATLVNGPNNTGGLGSLPLGVVTWDGDEQGARTIYATYQSVSDQKIWVNGLDLAADYLITPSVSLTSTYSYTNRTVFDGVPGGNGAPLMLNAAGSRGSLGVRYDGVTNGWSGEMRARFNEAYPVNSGVYATGVQFPIGAGNEGASPTPPSTPVVGCSTLTTGRFCYEDVPQATLLDASITRRFNLSGNQRILWTLNATNLLGNEVRTFPGVPNIGRLLMTRISYSF